MKKIYTVLFQHNLFISATNFRLFLPLIIVMVLSAVRSEAQTTYTWNQTGIADWTVATNWFPTRTPAANDILVFSNASITSPINIPNQTIGQLLISNNTIVNLQGAMAGSTLTINGLVTPGADLSVAAGSYLNINGIDSTTIFLADGATGIINGNMNFSNAAHRLDADDVNGIIFNNPSVFTQASGCTGSVFTTSGTPDAIVFGLGTTFISADGGNPFGLGQPNSKVVFQTGSLFKMIQNTPPAFSGRTYANFEVDFPTFSQSAIGTNPLVMDNLTITQGILNLNLTAVAGITVKGNISVAAGQTLTFNPATIGTLIFNGTTPQTITNLGTLTFGANQDVMLNNAAGLVLNSDITLGANAILNFTNGKITTGNNLFTITNTVPLAIIGVSFTNYFVTTGTAGGLKLPVNTTVNSYSFPIGTATNFKPAFIDFTTAPTNAGSLVARFKDGYPGWPNMPNSFMEGALVVNAISWQGSWFLDAVDGLAGGIYTGNFTGYGAPDINQANLLVLVKRPSSGGDWTLDGIHVTTTGGNLQPNVRRTGMVGFSEFGIAGKLIDALPINLNYLNGFKQNGSHNLNWKVTCNNNATATMSIERSATGRNFTTINTITADALRCQQPFNYTDANPLQGSNYYRLKMTDANGKVTYSSVIVLLNAATRFDIVGLSPNLVTNHAVLNVTAAQKTKMDVVVTDMAGRQVQKIAYNLIAGSNQFTINLANLLAGTYQVTGYTNEGKSKTIRFTKQ